jgi:SulP family sulfate permease
LAPANREVFERGGILGGKSGHQVFADLNAALAWCEDRLLAEANVDIQTGLASFEPWLQRQLGGDVLVADLLTYFERKDADGSQIFYREGEPADTLDLVAAGHLAIEIAKGNGENRRVRRTVTHTVVGEMGFFRRTVRSATVIAEGPVTLFTLNRASFVRMRCERPDLANAFNDFIIRTLADRIDVANREVAALEPLISTSMRAFARLPPIGSVRQILPDFGKNHASPKVPCRRSRPERAAVL